MRNILCSWVEGNTVRNSTAFWLKSQLSIFVQITSCKIHKGMINSKNSQKNKDGGLTLSDFKTY